MKRWIFILLIAFSLLPSCGRTDATSETRSNGWQEQYDLGMHYLSDGNYAKAVIAFTAAIEIDPKQSTAYSHRGYTYAMEASLALNSDEMLSYYERALSDYAKSSEMGDAEATEIYKNILAFVEELRAGQTINKLLQPLQTLLSEDNIEQAFALIRTEAYIKMSSALVDGFFLYSDGSEDCLAVYPNNYFYYGHMVERNREGHGLWMCAVYGTDTLQTYSQVYDGEWANDVPNGNGSIIRRWDDTREWEEDKGTFSNGVYNGSFSSVWHTESQDDIIWTPITAVDGIFQPYSGEIPQDIKNDEQYEEKINSGEELIAIDQVSGLTDLWDNGEIHYVFGFSP